MSEYYRMKPVLSTDYILVNAPPDILRGCINSEFQFLDKKPRTIEVSLEGGGEFPDFLVADLFAPYISDRLKRVFDLMGIDNLFYQKTVFVLREFDVEAIYWLAVPPKIHCIDPECVDEVLGVATEIKLLKEKIGNYKVFKASDDADNEIIVSDEVKNELEKRLNNGTLEGIKFSKL